MKFFLNLVATILLFIGSMRWLAGALKGDPNEGIRHGSLFLILGILVLVVSFFLKKDPNV